MKTPKKFISASLAMVALANTLCAVPTILLVNSYNDDYPWTVDIIKGVRKSLEGSDVHLEIYNMDTKNRPSEDWKKQSGAEAAALVDKIKPDVVITSDDNAQTYFAKQYAGKDSPKIVFCGVNASESKYGFPASNITGFLERPHLRQCLEFTRQLLPAVGKIAMLSDSSEVGCEVYEYVKKQPEAAAFVTMDQVVTFDQWKEKVTSYHGKADAMAVVVYQTIKRNAGDEKSMPAKEVMQWTVANAGIPIIGFYPFVLEDGALCGIVEDPTEHGFESAEVAKKLIAGGKVSDFSVRTARRGMVMINLTTAEKLGIPIPFEVIESADRVIK